jgi:hypothetical protein
MGRCLARWLCRAGCAALGLGAALVDAPAASAYVSEPSCKGLILVIEYDHIGGQGDCDWPLEFIPGKHGTSLDCDTGGARCCGKCTSMPPEQLLALSGYPIGNEPCETSLPGTFVITTCVPEELPNQCKGGPVSGAAPSDPAGEVDGRWLLARNADRALHQSAHLAPHREARRRVRRRGPRRMRGQACDLPREQMDEARDGLRRMLPRVRSRRRRLASVQVPADQIARWGYELILLECR